EGKQVPVRMDVRRGPAHEERKDLVLHRTEDHGCAAARWVRSIGADEHVAFEPLRTARAYRRRDWALGRLLEGRGAVLSVQRCREGIPPVVHDRAQAIACAPGLRRTRRRLGLRRRAWLSENV